MANFFTDNDDIQFLFEHMDLRHAAELTEDGFRFIGSLDVSFAVGYVKVDGMDFPAVFLEPGHSLIQSLLARIDDNNLHSVFHECLGYAQPDTTGTTGYKCDFPFDILHFIPSIINITMSQVLLM